MADWQLIGTYRGSPDDEVLVAKGRNFAIAQLEDREDGKGPRWHLSRCGSYAEDGDIGFTPTHWMSLPEPAPPVPEKDLWQTDNARLRELTGRCEILPRRP